MILERKLGREDREGTPVLRRLARLANIGKGISTDLSKSEGITKDSGKRGDHETGKLTATWR